MTIAVEVTSSSISSSSRKPPKVKTFQKARSFSFVLGKEQTAGRAQRTRRPADQLWRRQPAPLLCLPIRSAIGLSRLAADARQGALALQPTTTTTTTRLGSFGVRYPGTCTQRVRYISGSEHYTLIACVVSRRPRYPASVRCTLPTLTYLLPPTPPVRPRPLCLCVVCCFCCSSSAPVCCVPVAQASRALAHPSRISQRSASHCTWTAPRRPPPPSSTPTLAHHHHQPSPP